MHFILKKQLHWWHFLFMVKLEFLFFPINTSKRRCQTWKVLKDFNARIVEKPKKIAGEKNLKCIFSVRLHRSPAYVHAIYGVKTEITQRKRRFYFFTSQALVRLWCILTPRRARCRECQRIYVNPAHAANSNQRRWMINSPIKLWRPPEEFLFLWEKN